MGNNGSAINRGRVTDSTRVIVGANPNKIQRTRIYCHATVFRDWTKYPINGSRISSMSSANYGK